MTIPEPNETQMLQILNSAVLHVHLLQDFPAFLDWMQGSNNKIRDILPTPPDDQDYQALIHSFARAIWNATPLASNHYRPKPLPEPRRNERCYCGSGKKYKQCCQRIALPVPSTNAIWLLLLGNLRREELREAIRMKVVPCAALIELAAENLEEAHAESAEELLNAYFSQDLKKLDWQEADYAMMLLCDTYDMLDDPHGKLDFLHRITQEAPPKIRSSAWQRLATIWMDAGDHEAAWNAHHKAMALNPKDFGVALLELTLLLAEGKFDQIRNRAAMIQKQWQRSGKASDEQLDFIQRCRDNPEAMREQLFEDDDFIDNEFLFDDDLDDEEFDLLPGFDPLELALEWARAAENRPIPAYRIVPLTGEMDANSPQPSLFSPEATETIAHLILPPKKLTRIENRWRKLLEEQDPLFDASSPDLCATYMDPGQWLAFLQDHADSADSLKIMSEVVDMIVLLETDTNTTIANEIRRILGRRALAILEAPQTRGNLPAELEENTPLFILLFAYSSMLYHTDPTSDEALTLTSLMLELDPDDSINARALLADLYISRREDEKMLQLARQFPHDEQLPIRMGEALANYRLGDKDTAKRQWQATLKQHPLLQRYLLNSQVKTPELFAFADDETQPEVAAWVYRMKMRDTWRAERGALTWLKKNA